MTPSVNLTHLLSLSLSLALLLLSLAPKPATSLSGGNSCHRRTFERCVKGMLQMADPDFTYPSTLSGATAACRSFKVNHACAKNYTEKCLKGETKNTVSLIFYGFAKAIRANCATRKRKMAQLALARCGNAHRRDISQGIDLMNRQFHGIKVHPEVKERIPMVCCTYFAYKQTVMRAIGKDCTRTEMEGIEGLIDGFSADGLSIACTDYEENDRCTLLLGKIPPWRGPLDTPIFFLTVVDIIKGL